MTVAFELGAAQRRTLLDVAVRAMSHGEATRGADTILRDDVEMSFEPSAGTRLVAFLGPAAVNPQPL